MKSSCTILWNSVNITHAFILRVGLDLLLKGGEVSYFQKSFEKKYL